MSSFRFRLPRLPGTWRDWINPIPLAAVLLGLLFGWYIVFGDEGLLTLRRLHHTERELLQREQALSRRLDELAEETRRLNDPAYLEILLRKELGYVKPGEMVYQFTEEPEAPRHE